MSYHQVDGNWQQSYQDLPAVESLVSFNSLANIFPDNQAQHITAIKNDLQSTLHLSNGPLVQVAVFGDCLDKFDRLFITAHHLIIDGFSWRVLHDDLEILHHQFINGQALKLDEDFGSYGEWGEALQQYSESKAQQQLPYWQGVLDKAQQSGCENWHKSGIFGEAQTSTCTLNVEFSQQIG